MKKYYAIGLVGSFFVAVICIGASLATISRWETGKQQNMVRFFISHFTKDEVVFQDNEDGFKFNTFDKTKIIASGSAQQTVSAPAQSVQQIAVKLRNGDLNILKSDKNEIEVVGQDLKDDCQVYLLNDDDNTVKVRVLNRTSYTICDGSLTVKIPDNNVLTVHNGTGDVSVEGKQKKLDIKLGVGSLKFKGSSNEARVRMGSGDFTMTGDVQNLDAKLGLGSMDLRLKKLISHGEWELRTGTGDIKVYLPEGQIAEEKVKTGMGNTHVSNRDGKKSDFKISGKTGIGNIEIRN